MIVAFTGHRPNKLGGYGSSPMQSWVRARLREHLIELKPYAAISGMALGVDTWAAMECLELGVPLVAAVPFKGQQEKWPAESQNRHQGLLLQAKAVVYVSKPGYSAAKMQIRNEWMVNYCHTLIAVWDGTSGGTANCVKYAERVGRQIVHINPKEFQP